MPVITIQMAKGRARSVKRRIVKELTAVAVRNLDVRPEWVTVLLDEYPRDNWATAGLLHSDKFGKGSGRRGTRAKAKAR